MARTPSRPLALANAMRDWIAKHARENPNEWLTTPAQVVRGIKQNVIAGPFPAVVVAASESRPTDQGMSDAGPVEREELTLTVYGLVNEEDPDAAAHELAWDIRNAVANNRQLTDDAGIVGIPDGYIYDAGYEVRHEPIDVGMLGECLCTFRVDHQWTAT